MDGIEFLCERVDDLDLGGFEDCAICGHPFTICDDVIVTCRLNGKLFGVFGDCCLADDARVKLAGANG